MRYSIFSDIHANWQAWSAIRGDVLSEDVDVVVCLGDIIGYGPSPVQVLDDVLSNCSNIVVGNHDAAVSGRFDLDLFADAPRIAAEWTMEQMDESRLAKLRELPEMIEDDFMAFAHAETHAPEEYGYVSDTDDALTCLKASDKQFIFVGHTHIPAIFVQSPDGSVDLLAQTRVEIQPDRRYLVNVGSVGDPRDGGKKASYCICDLDAGYIELHKRAFDIETHYQEIIQFPQLALPHFLADRAGEKQAARSNQAIRVKKASRMTVRAARARQIQRRTGILSATTVAGMRRRHTGLGTGTAGDIGDDLRLVKKKNPMLLILIATAVATLVFLAIALGFVVYMMDRNKGKPQPGDNPPVAGKPTHKPNPGGGNGGVIKPKPLPPKLTRPNLADNVIVPDERGILRLNLDKVIMNGGGYKKETKGGIECIGYWNDRNAKARWEIWADKSGVYDVKIRYSLEKATTHEVLVGCGYQFVTSKLEPTGSWETFKGKSLGKIEIKAGKSNLDIKPEKMGRSGFMNLAAVRLTPEELVGEPETTTPTPAAASNGLKLIDCTLEKVGASLRFTTTSKMYGFAVSKTDKPVKSGTFSFNFRAVGGGGRRNKRYKNIFFVLGNSAIPSEMIKCEVHLGDKKQLVIKGNGVEVAGKKLDPKSAQEGDIKVEVDAAAKTVTLKAFGKSVTTNITRNDLPAVTHFGYGAQNAVSIVSPIKVKRAGGGNAGTGFKTLPISKATASSSESKIGNSPAKAVDGDLSTRWCASDGECPQWLQFDLGKRKVVKNVKIMWEKPETIYKYRIEVSEDGTDWKEVVDKTSNSEAVKFSSNPMDAIGRMVKITITGLEGVASWASIKEVKIEGTDAPPKVDKPDGDPEKLEIVGATASTSQTGSQRTPDKAIDGRGGMSRWCASGPSLPQWIELDLGKLKWITDIEIDWYGGPYEYQIETLHGGHWREVVDKSDNDEKGKITETIDAPARKIRITITGGAEWASITELKINGMDIAAPPQASTGSTWEKVRKAEAKGYQLLYRLYLSKLKKDNIKYGVDNSGKITGTPTRIAYYLELTKKGDDKAKFVFVSMDAFTTDFKKMGIPTISSGAKFQQAVKNMTVVSNVASIKTGAGLTGNIEFWPNNYSVQNDPKVEGASGKIYDFGDKISKGGDHGSMQIHNPSAKQTIFAINYWKGGAEGADIGIGNAPVDLGKYKSTDWTWARNSKDYTKKVLRVLVKTGSGSQTEIQVTPKAENVPTPDIYCSNLTAKSATSGSDRKKLNATVKLGGKKYENSIATHAKSVIVYDIPNEARRFVAIVGVNDAQPRRSQSSISFEVIVDGTPVGKSPVLTRHKHTWAFDIKLPNGAREIKLVVGDGGNGIDGDNANWVNVGFMK